jgi:hypothetical protein
MKRLDTRFIVGAMTEAKVAAHFLERRPANMGSDRADFERRLLSSHPFQSYPGTRFQ